MSEARFSISTGQGANQDDFEQIKAIDSMTEEEHRAEVRTILVTFFHAKLVQEGELEQTYSTQQILAEYTPRNPPNLLDSIVVYACDTATNAYLVEVQRRFLEWGDQNVHNRMGNLLNEMFEDAFSWPRFVIALLFAVHSARRLVLQNEPQLVSTVLEQVAEFFGSREMQLAMRSVGGWERFAKEFQPRSR